MVVVGAVLKGGAAGAVADEVVSGGAVGDGRLPLGPSQSEVLPTRTVLAAMMVLSRLTPLLAYRPPTPCWAELFVMVVFTMLALEPGVLLSTAMPPPPVWA